jgi:4-hydroxy-tetrahydrodipicolinate synthase
LRDGILSGHGSLIADLHVEIFEAVEQGDLARARRVSDRIYPLVQVFYAEPFLDGHNRMKEALAVPGRIGEAHVRPPLRRVSEAEREKIRRVVTEAGLPGARGAIGRPRWRGARIGDGPRTPSSPSWSSGGVSPTGS